MRAYLIFCCLLSICIRPHAQEKLIVRDPNAIERSISGFERIEVRGGIDLYISPDERETVVVSAREVRDRDRIVTRVTNGTLQIYYDAPSGNFWNSNMQLKVYLSFRKLAGLRASGASDVYVNGIIRADRFDLDISGASDFKGGLEVRELALKQSGSSDARISGRAEMLRLNLSGASDLRAYELVAEAAVLDVSGASDAQVNVSRTLDMKVSGASDVHYKGGATVSHVSSTGASSVKKVD